jgi:type VI secretion system FHA domain protein
MPITLTVLTYCNAAPAQALGRRFDRLGGAIGRAPGNELVLDDPGKYISRVHARIDYRDGGYCLVDVGSNPSLVNERPLGAGRHLQLVDGDRLTIGDYQLAVSVESEAAPVLPPSFAPAPLQAAAATSEAAPAPMPALPSNSDDSLAAADILNVGGDPLNPAVDPLGLNLFGAPAPAAAASSATPAYRGAESDHVAPELAAFPAIPVDYDPLAEFLPPRVQARTQAPPQPQPPLPAPEQTQVMAIAPAPPPAPPAPPAPASTALAARGGAAADDPVIRALLRGMGLEDLNTKRSAEEVAELAGAMLREASAGTMGVLMGRALTKRESRLEMTMISSQANNPLKFFPDAGSALMQMMNGSMPGYMAPPRAFANAFDDIKAHELAIMAGMRAALAGVLGRFDPQAIEARLEVGGMMDKVLSSSRKARMWDRMVELYTQLASEADSDFHRLFGVAFSKAYEEQIERLRKARG